MTATQPVQSLPNADHTGRGSVLFRTVPSQPALDYYLYVPRSARPGCPMLVAVHGISGNARDYARVFAPLAEERGVVLVAPHFAQPAFRDYQRLGRAHLGERADLALERLVAAVELLTGADGSRFHLFGHSGGGQFAQRYTLAHPDRVAAAVVVSSGWYTFPDSSLNYPYGIRHTARLPAVRLDLEAALRVPMLVAVGGDDIRNDRSLRRSPKLDRQQGETRLVRAQRFVESMTAEARERDLDPQIRLLTVADADHSFAQITAKGGIAPLAFKFLFRADEFSEAETA